MSRSSLGLLVVACLLVLVPGMVRPAAGLTALTFGTPDVTGQQARFFGKAVRPGVNVALQEWRGDRWATVGWDRTDTSGRYSLTRTAPSVRRTYRAKWGGTVSRTRTVAGVDACGVRPRKASGSLWTCTFVDGFAGVGLDDAKWQALTQPGSGTDRACNVDHPRTVGVSGGELHLTVRPVRSDMDCRTVLGAKPPAYAAGSVSTQARFAQQYGRFEVRTKATATSAPGLQEAFWLWPAYDPADAGTSWPESGEIDVAETYSVHPRWAIPYLHYGGQRELGVNTALCPAARGRFHTYRLTWSAHRLVVHVDGVPCLVHTESVETFRKLFFVNLTQLIGRGDNAYDGRAPLPATMTVDYVKVWR